jgi:Cd2+/Zn2+-exporting ATPase
MGCADNCHGELTERPTLLGSGPVRASALAWVFVLGGLAAGFPEVPPLVVTLLYAGSILAGGFYFAREAAEELWKGREVGIELLMTVAIMAAAALGRWREAALVASLYSITEALEGFTLQKTRYAIRSLMDLVPPKARVIREGREAEVDVKDVRPGDRVQVRPGESIPVDGVVRAGSSSVNEAAITGESLPADRKPGDAVFGGTLNGEGALEVEATKPASESTVAKIIEMVERAQAQKGKSQLFVEKFGKVYSPAVLGASVLLAIVPALLGLDWASWARRAVSFLVAASPCALAVATPVTLVAAIGSAARRGVLIKGGVIVETLGKVRAVAFDKTGTLTHGEPELTGVYVAEGDEPSLLR